MTTYTLCPDCSSGVANDDWTHLDYWFAKDEADKALAAIEKRLAALGYLSYCGDVEGEPDEDEPCALCGRFVNPCSLSAQCWSEWQALTPPSDPSAEDDPELPPAAPEEPETFTAADVSERVAAELYALAARLQERAEGCERAPDGHQRAAALRIAVSELCARASQVPVSLGVEDLVPDPFIVPADVSTTLLEYGDGLGTCIRSFGSHVWHLTAADGGPLAVITTETDRDGYWFASAASPGGPSVRVSSGHEQETDSVRATLSILADSPFLNTNARS